MMGEWIEIRRIKNQENRISRKKTKNKNKKNQQQKTKKKTKNKKQKKKKKKKKKKNRLTTLFSANDRSILPLHPLMLDSVGVLRHVNPCRSFFVISTSREKRDRRDTRGDEREVQWKKEEQEWKGRNRRNKSIPLFSYLL